MLFTKMFLKKGFIQNLFMSISLYYNSEYLHASCSRNNTLAQKWHIPNKNLFYLMYWRASNRPIVVICPTQSYFQAWTNTLILNIDKLQVSGDSELWFNNKTNKRTNKNNTIHQNNWKFFIYCCIKPCFLEGVY